MHGIAIPCVMALFTPLDGCLYQALLMVNSQTPVFCLIPKSYIRKDLLLLRQCYGYSDAQRKQKLTHSSTTHESNVGGFVLNENGET